MSHKKLAGIHHVDYLSSADSLNCSGIFNVCQVNVVDLQDTILHPVMKVKKQLQLKRSNYNKSKGKHHRTCTFRLRTTLPY